MKTSRGFTLIELLVVVAIIALLIAILLPSLSIAKQIARQTACLANVKGIGAACHLYQQDNGGAFPTAPHFQNTGTAPVVRYIGNMGGGPDMGPDPQNPARAVESASGVEGSTVVSTTRSLWMLVRGGGIVPKNFICPASSDAVDPTVDTTTYYDFIGFGTCSYGYQIPYDSANSSRPGVDVDPRMVLIADRGPWSRQDTDHATGGPPPIGDNPNFFRDAALDPAVAAALHTRLTDPHVGVDETDPPEEWRMWNSPNHGGLGQGVGQSALYPDGHAEFNKRPIAGVDHDNIYTRMGGWSGDAFGHALQWGDHPRDLAVPIYPGDGSLDATTDVDSTTDSLIWP